MFLTIDVGNTSIKWALFDGALVAQNGRSQSAASLLESLPKTTVHAALIASVVPSLTEQLCKALQVGLGIKAQVAGRDFAVPIENRCVPPERVGVDRLLNALAAREMASQSDGRVACVVVDVGSAITVDAVDELGRFLGGAIAPGPDLQARALHEHTALLPLVKVRAPKSPIGRSTDQAILSGIHWGVVGAASELVRRIAPLAGEPAVVFVTGGYGEHIVSETGGGWRWEPLLTLHGLRLAGERRKH